MNLKDIARDAGVSQACISLVRKGRPGVSAPVRARIQAQLEANGFDYAPFDPRLNGPAAGASPARSSRQIRLLTYKKHALLVDGNDGFVSSIIDALDQEARLQGYHLTMSVIGPGNHRPAIESPATLHADGVLVVATEMAQQDLEILCSIPLPLVILDSDFIQSPYSCVTMNNRELAFAAVTYLAELGHPSIGYLHSSVPTGNFRSRTQGYQEALQLSGQPYDEQLAYHLRPTMNGAYQDMLCQLKQKRALPSAFFADNDIIAIGAMKAMTELGLRIPHDISVVGVDNIPFGAVSTPPLTTMSVPCAEIGRWAIRLLLQIIQTPEMPKTKVQVGATLIRRSSAALCRSR